MFIKMQLKMMMQDEGKECESGEVRSFRAPEQHTMTQLSSRNNPDDTWL